MLYFCTLITTSIIHNHNLPNPMRYRFFTIALTLSVLLSTEISAQNWQTYPYTPPGSVLTFPDDDGVHVLNTTTEWWYVNMHLIGSAPAYREYDVMLCYFRLPINMRIFNIAEAATGIFNTSVQNIPPPVFTQQTGQWDFQYTYGMLPPFVMDSSYSTFTSSGIPYQYVFKADNPDNNDQLNLILTSDRPPLVVGGDGYVAIGDQGDSSFYYSYTNMSVTGTIKFNGVQDNISSGVAWIDRQWGPFTVGTNPDNMYEWFSLQVDKPGAAFGDLQSPSEFNIWQIYADSNRVPYKPESRSVSAIYPDDTQDTSSTFYFERLGYWYDQPNDVYYSQGWRFINPLRGVNIDMTQTIDNQVIDVTAFKFWEGSTLLKGTVNNQPVEGVGFAELVAGHNFGINPPLTPANLTVVPDSDHYSLSWSTSTQGTYPLGGYRIYRSFTNEGYWQYIASTTNLSYDDYSASPDSSYYYTVSSFDNQTATYGSDYATPALVSPLGINAISNISESLQNYPNPFSTSTTISFFLHQSEQVTLKVFDLLGREVTTLLNDELIAGKHSITIDAKDLPAGIYLLKLQSSLFVQQKLMEVTK